MRGGFPEAVARSNARRRQRFHDSYVADLVTRDVAQLSDIERAKPSGEPAEPCAPKTAAAVSASTSPAGRALRHPVRRS